jgi:Kef-type K+ transport system membrane component KefB
MVVFDLIQGIMAGVPADLVILTEIGAMIIIATVFAYFVKIIKQPLIPAYILTGIILGPLVLGLVSDPELILSLSNIGIAFLIFTAGLEIKLKKLKEVGSVSSIGGILQIVIMFGIGFLVALGLGFTGTAPAYVALVVALSSTMIVVTLLAEKRELNSLHGRIVIGILLMQDIAAIVALTILSSDLTFNSIVWVVGKAILFAIIALLLSKVANPIFRSAADSRELFLLVSISFLFLFSIGAFFAELSIIIGAFFAGVALANSDYKTEILGNITPLREFFAVIFFVALGMQLKLISKEFVLLFFVLLFLVIIIKPVVIMFLVRLFHYKKRTSFFTANALAQTSEFSLIIVTIGLGLGHISEGLFSTLVLLTILTMSLTTYFITYEKKWYSWFSWPLNILDRYRTSKENLEFIKDNAKDVIIFGSHRTGSLLLREFKKDDLLVVDYNPEIIKNLINKKIACVYGDYMHEEILEKVNLRNSKIVVSTIPDFENNLLMVKRAKKINRKLVVIIVASRISEALKLYNAGADYVILPKVISGEAIVDLVKKGKRDKTSLGKMRRGHVKRLKEVHRLLY